MRFKSNFSYSLAPETSLVFALKDSVKGTDTISASTGTPGVPVDAEVVSVPFTESFNANTREVSGANE